LFTAIVILGNPDEMEINTLDDVAQYFNNRYKKILKKQKQEKLLKMKNN
jgi:hypothetical protein